MRRIALCAAVLVVGAACTGGDSTGSITIYSGREEELVGAIFEQFTRATGVETEVRYGDSAALAAQILEEGDASPADVFFAQDAGALGAVADAGLLTGLPNALLQDVPAAFRSADGSWVGITGRVRTVVYNTEALAERDLPGSILDFTARRWNGTLGWAPTNASFQAFVTALRLTEGERAARTWLRGIKANRARDYPKNTPIVEAVAAGDLQAGFVNHYYLLRLLAEDPGAPAANHFLPGDIGGLVNVAGAGVLASSDDPGAAETFISFLLSDDTQRTFVRDTFEYPLVDGVEADARLPELAELDPPAIDLSRLADLQATLDLLAEEGLV